MKFLYVILFLIISNSYGKDMLKLEDLSVEVEKYEIMGNTRHPYMYKDAPPNYGLNLNMKLSLMKYLYNNSQVLSLTDQSQFRFIGLKMENGIEIDKINIYHRHFSGHALDTTYQDKYRFPEENAIGIRINLLSK